MLLLYYHVDKGDNSIFYSKLMENFWVIPLLGEDYDNEKRDNSWKKNLIFFLSVPFLGGVGVYQYYFLHWFYYVYFNFGVCYFMNHWIFLVCGFFFSFSLIIVIPYKLPNFFSVNSDYIYLIPSITKPEKPSGTVTRKSLTSRYACRENTTSSTFNLRI